MVNRGKVTGSEKVVPRETGSEVRRDFTGGHSAKVRSGLWLEVVKIPNRESDAGQRSRHRRLGGIGEMHFTIHQVVMEFSVEGRLDLSGGPAEEDFVAAGGDAGHGEVLRLQPGNDLADVAFTHSEAIAELRWSQPLVVVRRHPVLLLGEQLVQIALLGWGGFEHERESMHRHAAIDATLIELWPRPAVQIALQGDGEAGLDRCSEAVDGGLGQAQSRRQQKYESLNKSHTL